MPTIFKKFYVKILFIIVGIYSLIGFIIVPYLIQSNFSNLSHEKFNVNAYLSRVYINPYTFEVGLHDLLIKDDKQETLLYFKSFKTNLELYKLLFGEIELDYIHIDSLKTVISLYKDNNFNFSHILEQLSQKEQEQTIQNKETNSSPLLFSFHSLLIRYDTII